MVKFIGDQKHRLGKRQPDAVAFASLNDLPIKESRAQISLAAWAPPSMIIRIEPSRLLTLVKEQM